MKKGFTLIELLAVIVILAIIALIATPIILGIINDSKNEANERSVELYVKAAELAVARKNMTEEFKPTECTVENGVCTCDGKTLQVDVENGSNINGTITFNDKGVVTDNTLVVGTSSTPTPVGEQYLYQWHIGSNKGGPRIGNSINLTDYPEENGFIYSATAPEGKTYYNKFKIEDNVVTEGYACAILGGEERCLRGMDKDGNNFYGDDTTGNRGYLKTLHGTNGISCSVDSRYAKCCDGSFCLSAWPDGMVFADIWPDECLVNDEGFTSCETFE